MRQIGCSLVACSYEQYCGLSLQGTPCDLVTGEERRFANDGDEPSNHISCTVEMASVSTSCEGRILLL